MVLTVLLLLKLVSYYIVNLSKLTYFKG